MCVCIVKEVIIKIVKEVSLCKRLGTHAGVLILNVGMHSKKSDSTNVLRENSLLNITSLFPPQHTALHKAVYGKIPEIVELLINHGAPIGYQDQDGVSLVYLHDN